MRLRPLTPDDAQALTAIAVERGWRPHTEAWRVALALGAARGFEEPGGGLAAAALLVPHGGRCAVLSVLVSPRHSGTGLGRRVAEAALAGAGPLEVEIHAPPGGVPFAARLGFRPVGSSTRFGGRPVGAPRPGGSATLRPVGGTDFPALVAVDEVAFGALRRPLLEALFPMATRACLAIGGGRTVGYGIAWAEGEQLAVGPVVAEEDATGAAMVAWLAGTGDSEVRIDVPLERGATASIALAAGLAPLGRITRLVRGPGLSGRRERLHALAAPWAG
jgi:ribosomal protein S18 acetylase RimI-like enzyme